MRRLLYLLFLQLFSALLFAQTLTIEQKIESYMQQMTLADKCKQLYPYDVMNTADDPRLKIPGFYCTDGPHGYRYPESTGGSVGYYLAPPEAFATSFPVSIGVSATWDPDLARRMARAMAREFRANGIDVPLGPSMYLCNDPRNGRSAESYGEDPFLCAKIGVGTVLGMQSAGTISCIKAFLCENAQATRMTDTITISRRVALEHWGLPFKATIQDANAFSTMSAYVAVNGVAASQSYDLNTTLLRERLGFPYFLVSDWGSVHNAAEAIASGLDLDMGSTVYAYNLEAGVNAGEIAIEDIDKAVENILRTKLMAGIVDYRPESQKGIVSGDESQALNYETGLKGLVLLKNDSSVLPINKNTVSSVALIGPNAVDCPLDGYGSSFVFPTYMFNTKMGFEQRIGYDKVNYVRGCNINDNDTSDYANAIAAAAQSDYVVFVGGLNMSQEGEMIDRVGGSVELPAIQQNLINRLSEANSNIIVVLLSGGIASVNNCLDNIKGLIYGFYPGQEQGRAITDIVFGDYNPGGKLPVTMPAGDYQIPESNTNFNDDMGGGYRWYDQNNYTPAFAFGHGLSYTTFSYNSATPENTSIDLGQDINFTVNVSNTGTRKGDEVIQVYVSYPDFGLEMPIKQLKAFKRLNFNPGEIKDVVFTIKAEDLYVFDPVQDRYLVPPGEYTFKVGGASDSLPLQFNVTLNDVAQAPDLYVSKINCYPPYPQIGDTVMFSLNIKNQGTGNLNSNVKAKVFVNGTEIAQIDTNISILCGGMQQISAHKTVNGKNFFVAEIEGVKTISTQINYDNSVTETITENNTTTDELIVYSDVLEQENINLALNKPVSASSIEDTVQYRPEWAVDGLRLSRWSNDFSNTAWLQVDLLNNYIIEKVVIKWHTSFASEYQVCASLDGNNWDTVATVIYGTGKTNYFELNNNARYLKVVCTDPATPWGFSIHEFEAYGRPQSFLNDIHSVNNQNNITVFPNPFSESISIKNENEFNEVKNVMLYDLSGKIIKQIQPEKGFNNIKINNLMNIEPGIYVLMIESEFSSRYVKIIKQ